MVESEKQKAIVALTLGTLLVLPGVIDVMLGKVLGPVGKLLKLFWK